MEDTLFFFEAICQFVLQRIHKNTFDNTKIIYDRVSRRNQS